ncbi:nitric oxide dioxygenase [Saccharopolyspora kobensis]|uniref:nitric oxide dioxygenase n=1 Tax=Saccharopolyspora kobensis TaxID=146035 RepID=A0A1H5U1X0_9PSEU|nr:globin domain-containing protein [Saccharopolyspora kobensis]SEF69132.1 nitric oxide dioxygenase [Saccharopolyspora kobensis]SFC78174.1 nitric oxide dioxygenase [Saccharopolyspora kobensis]
MLSSASTDVVRATLPVIGAAIDDITPVFYRRLFAAHPELERDLFNRGNQAQGDQQRALAAAIAGYATLLVAEHGPDPRSVLARIAHKHASLGITADQYPIVHEHLFAAIAEVLGEAVVTPEVAAAWDEVYWHMAQSLIEIERDLCTGAGLAPGEVWRTLSVRRRVQEAPDTVSFVLETPDGAALPPARPGQYVSVAVGLPDGARQIRQYSVTHVPDEKSVGISVKAVPAVRSGDALVPAGEVSNFLHDNVFEGDELQVSAPFGELVLTDGEVPLVLVSAGIGITPVICYLHHLRRTSPHREVLVLHADRSPARHAHRAELKALVAELPAATLHRWYEDLGTRRADTHLRPGRIDLADVEVPAGAEAYLCGPVPFMAHVRRQLIDRGLAADRIHFEVFGPSRALESA